MSYINGRHRVTVTLQAGVRRTVVIHWVMPEATGTGARGGPHAGARSVHSHDHLFGPVRRGFAR